jgi:hypothetical protein
MVFILPTIATKRRDAMKTLGILLLLASTVFGQNAITDTSDAGCPLRLSGSTTALSGLNVSSKEILFYAVDLGGDHTYRRDYYFKRAGIQPGATENIVSASVGKYPVIPQAKVQYVQFVDGTSWGDYNAATTLLEVRPVLLGLFNQLITAYNMGGETGVVQLLNGLLADKTQVANVHGMATHFLLADQSNGIAGVIFDLNKRVAAAESHSAALQM